MNENELIELFSRFGYEILKHGTHYSIFDRRLARRTVETNSLDGLRDYAENIYLFPFMAETLEKTLAEFKRIYGLTPDEPLSDTFKQIYGITPDALETVTGEEGQTDPEQEQESSPVSPVTDPDTGDQDSEQGEPEPEQTEKDSPSLFTKICKGCGREFQTAHKQSMYCSPACYPSNKDKQTQTAESPEKHVAVMQRPF